MNETQLLMLLGLGLNLLATFCGALSLAFIFWRWISKLGERVASVETHIKHLLRAHGAGRRVDDCDDAVSAKDA